MTSAGTRMPSPSGPVMPRSSLEWLGSRMLEGVAVRYSPAVPAGAVGGGTWSNQPSFSSYMRNRAVFDQTAGLAVSAFSTIETKNWPWLGEADW